MCGDSHRGPRTACPESSRGSTGAGGQSSDPRAARSEGARPERAHTPAPCPDALAVGRTPDGHPRPGSPRPRKHTARLPGSTRVSENATAPQNRGRDRSPGALCSRLFRHPPFQEEENQIPRFQPKASKGVPTRHADSSFLSQMGGLLVFKENPGTCFREGDP